MSFSHFAPSREREKFCGAGYGQRSRDRSKHTPEQVVRRLAQADRLLGEGKDVAEVSRELQVSEETYSRTREPPRT
jgi:hypothetical protein